MSLVQSALVTQQYRKDPGTEELVRALDMRADECWDPDRKRHRIELLSKREYQTVIDELSKCQDDFSYASRNYFKIVTKKGDDVSLRVNESQELVLEIMRMIQSRGKSQRIMIIKARQLGMSTLIEALIAWRTMFFPNARAIVVSDNADNAADLFGKMLHIYDHMPWWLKPMIDRRKEDKGLKFDNPDEIMRFKEPGLQSSVSVQAATQITGVGQGRSINSAHLSEWADWQEDKAIEIIQEDIGNALAEDPYTFAFLESTAKGSGTFAHKLWRRQVALAELAEWYPLFIPWFFDREHFVAPSKGWRPDQTSSDLRERVARDWARCTACGSYREIAHNGESLIGTPCWGCGKGTFEEVVLGDEQLHWRQNRWANSSMDAKTRKTFLQEQPSTSEEAFQVSGYTVFPLECIEFVSTTIDKRLGENGGPSIGHFDEHGRYHAMVNSGNHRRCRLPDCAFDHAVDPNHLKVWQEPIENATYVVGADVSEGLGGDSDYSVAFVNRIGGFGQPDTHVATFRCNEIGPLEFGDFLNFLGRWYNEALMSVEVNKYDSCFTQVKQYHQYPNNFRWKYVDATNTQSNRWGWWTTLTTKPRLYQTGSMWLRKRQWIIRDEEFYEEMLTFQKLDPEDRVVGSEAGFHDDVVMAGLIALYTSHDLDWDENLQYIPTPNAKGIVAGDQWFMSCTKCGFHWSAGSPDAYKKCPNDKAGPYGNSPCRSIQITGKFITTENQGPSVDIDKEFNYSGDRSDRSYVPSYDEV